MHDDAVHDSRVHEHSAHDHAARRARLRERLATLDVEALLVTSLVNVRYLSGFSGSNAALLVPTDDVDDALLCTDGRYVTQAATEAPDVPLLEARSCAVALLEQVAGLGLVRVGFESAHLSVADLGELRRAVPSVQLVQTVNAVEPLRETKSESELALLQTACAISCAALDQMLAEESWRGRTERDLAATLELRMRRLGAEAAAFETIIGSGPNSAVPHHQPGDRPLSEGDLVVVDFGARVGGYHADMTRTFVVGEPADWQHDLVTLVAAAQLAGRDALRAGATCESVDGAARGLIAAAGHGAHFAHGTGHGVGLEIHEAPQVGPGATGTLAAAVPVTVEPGVYLPGRGGVRIEDTMVVTAEGATALTTTDRALRVLD